MNWRVLLGVSIGSGAIILIALLLPLQPIQHRMNTGNETAIVTRIIDLDTIELDNEEHVRLLCINAPERQQPYTTDAERVLAVELIGTVVTLVRDVSDTDAYGRKLRHIYTPNGSWVQERLVRAGFVRVFPYEPDTTFCKLLEEAAAEAKYQHRGIWTPKIPICDNDLYDCDDFADAEQARALFAACGAAAHDVHKLDGDNDGEVCEDIFSEKF